LLESKLSQVGHLDVIFHLGALLPRNGLLRDETDFFISNGVSTYKLLKIAQRLGISTFVYASSLPLIGKPNQLPITEQHPVAPLHPYLLSKYYGELACELVRRTTKIRVTSLRISSPYGPGMAQETVLPRFVNQALACENIYLLGSGQRTQNFVHVKDVVKACMLAANTPCPGVYNIGGRKSYSMLDLAKEIINFIPGSSSQIYFTEKGDPQDDYRWEVSLARSIELLKYFPEIDFQDGLKEYIHFHEKADYSQYWWKTL
jgi:UDP-glucose 4-epimerase